MVQIKLFVAFLLAGAAIVPAVALPVHGKPGQAHEGNSNTVNSSPNNPPPHQDILDTPPPHADSNFGKMNKKSTPQYQQPPHHGDNLDSPVPPAHPHFESMVTTKDFPQPPKDDKEALAHYREKTLNQKKQHAVLKAHVVAWLGSHTDTNKKRR